MKNWKFIRKWKNSRFYSFFSFLHNKRKKGLKVRFVFIIYLLIVLAGWLFLSLPFSQTGNEKVSISDAFFTAISAFSDTGLVTSPTYSTWTITGQAIIAILIFIGGLGIFALKIFIINFIFLQRKRTSLTELELVSTERSSSNSRMIKKVIVDSILFLLITFVLFSFILSLYFYFATPWADNLINKQDIGDYISPQGNWALSFRYGFFHSISALNNAGFDIIGKNSLSAYYGNYTLQIIFLILFLIGGLGYPVIHDISNYFRHKLANKPRKYHWSLFTKLSLSTYFIVTCLGFLTMLTFEGLHKNPSGFWKVDDPTLGTYGQKLWALLFLSFSSRSAGFATFNLAKLSTPALFMITMLMFIGAAPSSTGGGIRTTTFGILIITLFSKILGHPQPRVFKRRISQNSINNSFMVFFISLALVIAIGFGISTSSVDYFGGGKVPADTPYMHYIFETASAFGTSGLTVGITDNMNLFSKIIISILMFIGQLGITSTILIWGKKRNYSRYYEYISEDIVTG
ncbi:TrkH family potassium uptake protein [Mycoplasmopsis gallinarum]|uniref:TrkH family potassium uptake protein n=1 Tax=Mycoplasmopsis gallinarum TaxID=29557 RepID=UPI0004832622|nr:potassium transporter TrkG [Mycoplasmopsis gallinarum]